MKYVFISAAVEAISFYILVIAGKLTLNWLVPDEDVNV